MQKDSRKKRKWGKKDLYALKKVCIQLNMSEAEVLEKGLTLISGKTWLSPSLIRAFLKKKGHRLEILSLSETFCCIRGQRTPEFLTVILFYDLEYFKKNGKVCELSEKTRKRVEKNRKLTSKEKEEYERHLRCPWSQEPKKPWIFGLLFNWEEHSSKIFY